MRLRAFLVVLCSFAWVALAPAAARAAFLPACENEVGISVVPPQPEPSCEVVTAIDDATGETSAAPICDARGASAIAPPRIRPIVDARIEASPTCGSDGTTPAFFAPPRGDGKGAPPSLGADPTGLLGALAALPRWSSALVPAFLDDAGAPRAANARGVYHPPR